MPDTVSIRRSVLKGSLFLTLAFPILLGAQPRWRIQYFYDKPDSVFDIVDLVCPSAQRCVAAGAIMDNNGHEKGQVLLTNDGGKQWSLVEAHERPQSLFFLDESVGWMVTDRGVWSTDEGGRSWKKLPGLKKGIVQVHFLNRAHGFAIGFPKAIFETDDGGKTWTKVPAAEKEPSDPVRTVYDCIDFTGQHGVIAGSIIQPSHERAPIWMNPNTASLRRQRRSQTVLLETMDGGKTWASATISQLGRVTRLKLSPLGFVLLLLEYEDYFTLPSSLSKLKLGAERAQDIFGERDRAVTDFALFSDGSAILATIQPPGPSNQVPIPGKLKMYESNELKAWLEQDADYRAVAQRAVVAGPDPHHVWVATDTGMILRLSEDEKRP